MSAAHVLVVEDDPTVREVVVRYLERDGLDVPRLKVDWKTTALDLDSLARSYRLLASELQRTGTGRLDYDPVRDVLYLMKMGSQLYKLPRGR